jgi:hypothetical protein
MFKINNIIENTSPDIISSFNAIDDKLLILINKELNTEEQQQFVNNFIIYLKYGNDNTKFIINLDDIWIWIGFDTKGNAKRLLVKKFIENIDYIYYNSASPKREALLESNIKSTAHNKETILFNVDTFKNFCLMASTENAKKIRSYYIKMENIMFKYTEEKLIEYQQQLEKTQNKLNETQNKLNEFIEYDEELFWNENQINDFEDKNVIYLAFIGIFNNERIYKLGRSENVYNREYKQHQKFYEIFKMKFVIECDNMNFVERAFKKFLKSINLYRNIEIKDNNITELFTINEKQNIDYIIDNLKKIVEENPLKSVKLLQDKLKEMKEYLKNLDLEENYNEYINNKNPIKIQETENNDNEVIDDNVENQNQNQKQKIQNIQKKENSTSIYIGVSKRNDNIVERYRAFIIKDGIHYNLGQYDNEIKAAIAYNLKAKELYKNFAPVNMIDINESLYNEYKNEVLENWNKDKTQTSKYKGVYKSGNNINPWKGKIFKNKEYYNLGYYDTEIKAALAYNIKSLEFDENCIDLNILDITDDIRKEYEIEIHNKWAKEKTSTYHGVRMKPDGKFTAQIYIDGKNEYIGIYDEEIIAAIAYNIKSKEASLKYNKKFTINDINIDEKTYNTYVNQIEKMGKKTKSSIYNGVCLSKGKWGVSITIDGKKKYLGCYDNEIKAAMVYNKKAIEVYGKEYKKINDIDIDKELYEEYKQELNII